MNGVNKPDIKIKQFNGNQFNVFKNDIERYLIAINRNSYIELEPSKNENFNKQQDIYVQLKISSNCNSSIRQNLELAHKESAYHMWRYLNTEYGRSSKYAISNALKFITQADYSRTKNIEDYINKFNLQWNTFEFNDYVMNDRFKIIFFFNGIGPSSTTVEQHCLSNNLTYAQTLSYARDNLPLEPNQVPAISFNLHMNDQSKYKKTFNDKKDSKVNKDGKGNNKRFKPYYKGKFYKSKSKGQSNSQTNDKSSVHQNNSNSQDGQQNRNGSNDSKQYDARQTINANKNTCESFISLLIILLIALFKNTLNVYRIMFIILNCLKTLCKSITMVIKMFHIIYDLNIFKFLLKFYL